ncbi:uncharacterized protein PGTG_21604 [Puccinia graminis f. sp. tritici CRL 75-36-700-3]|uniref:Uncharacterized protein n=1 Tax=Puccinia graminis f. sp. tritici (strain CRL 75-36-700-3 / race SCCL) TaxID=418459 RepID=H6QS28_PUCGT|nr:uncharacterized protein PGTG_21604 [Puccinia graminis f. sp. tritici CRL 75-36-700-3]EHS63474.1 hypothetical protein PGTG_21604 [Puccinia graminis f. sp. tritici CRL 75-36-700-3]
MGMEREQIFIDPFKGPSAVLFIKAFTLWSIYPEIIFLTGWTTLLVLLDEHVSALSLKLPPTILTVLGAYERYTDGRKQWSTIVHVSRTLTCLVWSHCPYPLRLPTASQPATETESTEYFMKTCTPEEEKPPRCTPTTPFPPPHKLLPNYNPPEEKLCECMPLGIFKSIWKGTRNVTGLRKKKANYSRRIHDDNIPLEMICCMSAYIATLQQRGVLNVPLANSLLVSVSCFSDSLATLERILTTPIPFGYIVHLRLIIWGYLIFLPFQLMSTFGYVTIPATALISIAFLGFLKIGEEIENPFGYDSNDLDMDHFCQNLIGRELAEITALPAPDPEEFMFSPFNLPLYRQHDDRSATELASVYSSSADIQGLLRKKASIAPSSRDKR